MGIFNSIQVEKTLKLVVPILHKHKVEYRILGSIVTSAIIGKQHRNLGDVDLIVDRNKREVILSELYQHGYYHRGGMFAFARKYLDLDSLENDEYLEVGMFWGEWNDGDFTIGTKRNGITVDKKALMENTYTLHDVSFFGLPKEVIYRGLMMSSKNPKRQIALKHFEDRQIIPMSNSYIHTRLLGIQMDYVYYFVMHILNLIGRIRVRVGKPFDPWR